MQISKPWHAPVMRLTMVPTKSTVMTARAVYQM